MTTVGVPVNNAVFGSSNSTIWLDDVVCRGQERDLGQCGHREFGHNDCKHREDAGVICVEQSGKEIQTCAHGLRFF